MRVYTTQLRGFSTQKLHWHYFLYDKAILIGKDFYPTKAAKSRILIQRKKFKTNGLKKQEKNSRLRS